MSSSTPRSARQTRATATISHPSNESAIVNDLQAHLHASSQFIDLYNRYFQSVASRPLLLNSLCQILPVCLQTKDIDRKSLVFIVDCLTSSVEHLTEMQFREDLLPLMKHVFAQDDDHDVLLSSIRCLLALIKQRSSILNGTLAEWLSAIFQFFATHLSPSTYLIYDDLLNDLLVHIVKHFSPLSKDIVDVLARPSSTILSTNFLNHLKAWINNADDLRFALFALQLWQSLAKLLSRLVIRGHAKGNNLLAVLEEAFTNSNYAIQSAVFTAWSSFISHLHQLDDLDQPSIQTRLLKLFLTPFLSDSTSKSKSASISKCHAWTSLISFYPKNVSEVILPFLSFAFGNELTSKASSTTTAWWPECRHIGGQYLHDLLADPVHSENAIRTAGDQILNYVFDFVVDQFLETTVQSHASKEKPLWLLIWNAFLKHLMTLFQSNNAFQEKQRVAINTCLLKRIEHCWIDSRIETRLLLKLFETFEQIGFPLAIETVLRDTSVRTKTLSATQNYSFLGNNKSQDKALHCRTTLSDQYLHMMIEHGIRFNDDDQITEDAYLHVISYLIETLSKTSDENFCLQTTSLLLKCSAELPIQPMAIPSLFWHIWFRCSTHLIQILNRSHTFELNNPLDNQKQDTSMELLLRPFAFNDIPRLDYSHTALWIQLFKALCRLAMLNHDQSKSILIHLLAELLRNKPAFEEAIHDEHNQRLFGWMLIIIKTLIKTMADFDLFSIHDRSTTQALNLFSMTQKRSLPSSMLFCLTQLSTIVNDILQRSLSNSENNTQYLLVCSCLLKSNKSTSMEQSKSTVFTYLRDILVDLFNLCKIYAHLEILLKNLTELLPFLLNYESSTAATTTGMSSPVSIQKQTTDLVLLTKILAVISSVSDPAHSSSLLQLSSSLLILAFQHSKTIMRNKARKCWNETFGRLTFLVYPNELRACLRELKDKEHLLLPCFLADQDNSNTAGSGAPPSSTDESQLSQQIDIVTPLIRQPIVAQQRLTFSSPTRVASIRPTHVTQEEPVFVPITNTINYNNQLSSPVNINKRRSASVSACLTEKQKEKLRTRHVIPLLCDEHSNTQSSSCTVDTLVARQTINDDLHHGSKLPTSSLPLFNPPLSQASSLPPMETEGSIENDSSEKDPSHEDDVSEESSIAKKLRRSCRPSISARKSLVNKTQKKPSVPLAEELMVVTPTKMLDHSPSASSDNTDLVKKHSIKSILKRLSPTKPRSEHKRRVVFHDQVKVLVFASPLRRDPSMQQKKKSPTKDECRSPTRTIPRENLPLRKQPMSAKRLSAMPPVEPTAIAAASPSPANLFKGRSSKLFHPKDAIADWAQTHPSNEVPSDISPEVSAANGSDSICPSLASCDEPLNSLVNLLFDGVCPSETLDDFHSLQIKTVGDLARSTAAQIETYPIPAPKLLNAQKALALFQAQSVNAKNDESFRPAASTSEEINSISSSHPSQENAHVPLYDVDTLIDSLDCENLHLTDHVSHRRNDAGATMNTAEEFRSPAKRPLLPINRDESEEISPKKPTLTLGDRLQKAADVYQAKGLVPFDNEYIGLVRQLLDNATLTHLEKLHLRSLLRNP